MNPNSHTSQKLLDHLFQILYILHVKDRARFADEKFSIKIPPNVAHTRGVLQVAKQCARFGAVVPFFDAFEDSFIDHALQIWDGVWDSSVRKELTRMASAPVS
jgi:hypothetical protein